MKKMVYTNKIDDEIIFHENNMLALYLEKAKKYMPFFEKSGYSLKVGLMWKYFPRDTIILQRGSFQNGYQCYVYCVVQKMEMRFVLVVLMAKQTIILYLQHGWYHLYLENSSN